MKFRHLTSKPDLYILRHGQTDFNLNKLVQGRGIDAPLNAHGRSQGEAFCRHYAEVPFEHAFVSSLVRSKQTIAPFLEKGLPYLALSGLDEFSWGDFEGRSFSYGPQGFYQEMLKAWASGDLDFASPQGESPNQVAVRQAEALEQIFAEPRKGPLLICMHGRAMRLLLCTLTGTPASRMDEFEHDNTSLYVLTASPGAEFYSVKVVNSREHLANSCL